MSLSDLAVGPSFTREDDCPGFDPDAERERRLEPGYDRYEDFDFMDYEDYRFEGGPPAPRQKGE